MSTATQTTPKKKPRLRESSCNPLGDRVVVKRESPKARPPAASVSDSAKDKPSRRTVIAVGDGKLLDDGSRGKLQVKVGDKVLFTS